MPGGAVCFLSPRQEMLSGNLDKPKIPDVCKALGVTHMSLVGLIKAEHWTFK